MTDALRAVQSELESSTADWLIVIGNDPVWSAGANGPTPGLAGRLLPMLETAVRAAGCTVLTFSPL